MGNHSFRFFQKPDFSSEYEFSIVPGLSAANYIDGSPCLYTVCSGGKMIQDNHIDLINEIALT